MKTNFLLLADVFEKFRDTSYYSYYIYTSYYSDMGYVVEVDVEYREHLHDPHSDYQLAPDFELMNNAVHGKTMKDVQKRKNVALVHPFHEDKIRRLVANPAFISRKIFSKDLAAIHSATTKTTLNRPIYVQMYVLNLSKL